MDTVHCVTSAHSSTFHLPISYHIRSREPSLSSSMSIRTHREVHTGWPCTSDPNPRVATTSIRMASYCSYRPSRRSLNATARPGTLTGDNCKASQVTSAASTFVYSPSTWIGATHRNSSSRCSMLAITQTTRWSDCSLPNLGPKCRVVAGVNAAAAAYKR